MDWKSAIERNRAALVAVLAGLVPLLEAAYEVPHPCVLCRFIARILRPAEAALRRLIVVLAAMMEAKAASPLWGGTRSERSEADRVGVTSKLDGSDLPPPGSVSRCEPVADLPSRGRLKTARPLPDFSAFARGQKIPAFPLIDPRKRFGGTGEFAGLERVLPRFSVPGVIEPFKPAKREETADTKALLRRIARLEAALKTLPKQARRLNRLMRKRSKAAPGPGRVGPIRPGHPPGYKRRSSHEIHAILGECHFLARECGLKPP